MTSHKLESIAEEIRKFQRIEREAVFEIGRLLKKVKDDDLAHGQFTEWLSTVGYNTRTAQRYMQIFDRFNAIEGAESVSIGNLTELLSLPSDVDASQFIEAAKVEPVRKVREMVREVKQKETSGNSRPVKPSTSTHSNSPIINTVTRALNNLIPEILACVEAKQLSLDDAVKIGEYSAIVQQRLASLGVIDPDDLDELLFIVCNEDNIGRAKEIVKILKLINESYGLFSTNALFVSLAQEIQSLYNSGMYELFATKVEELYQRLDEFEDKRKQEEKQQHSWEDYFSQFNWDSFKSTTTGFNTNSVSAEKMLGLDEGAGADDVKKKYRQLMKVLHPDQGGSAYLFDLIKKAYDDYRKEAV
jgi:hypothetical protein